MSEKQGHHQPDTGEEPPGPPRTPRGYLRRGQEDTSRPSFYMTNSLLEELDAQAAAENTNRSALVTEIITLALTSDLGKELRKSAKTNQRNLGQEIRYVLAKLPLEEIMKLADEEKRETAIELLVELISLGLEKYKQGSSQDT